MYVRVDLLRPGDVILTGGTQKPSRIIARFTRGLFSHAALVLNSTTRFEALGDGIGMTPARVCRAEYYPETGYRLLEDFSAYSAAAIFRHPGLANYSLDLAQSKVLDLITPFIGLEYPSLTELATAVSANPAMQQIARTLLRTAEKTKHKPLVPGPFCSQLIALVFASLDLPLFPDHREPRRVNPNDLARSLLQRVPEIVCEKNDSAQSDQQLVNELNSMSAVRREDLTTLVAGKRLMEVVARWMRVADSLRKCDTR